MKAVVFGSGGGIGSDLVGRFSREGIDVVCVNSSIIDFCDECCDLKIDKLESYI